VQGDSVPPVRPEAGCLPGERFYANPGGQGGLWGGRRPPHVRGPGGIGPYPPESRDGMSWRIVASSVSGGGLVAAEVGHQGVLEDAVHEGRRRSAGVTAISAAAQLSEP